MKKTFPFKFLFLTSFLQITSLQVNKENHLFVSRFICVSVLIESLVEIKIEITSRLHCIDIYDVDCKVSPTLVF